MSKGAQGFHRQANPTAMIFRLSFIHGLYVLPGWYIFRNLNVETLPGMLGTFFSGIILLAVFQIRLRRRINGKADTMVNDALVMYSGNDSKEDLDLGIEIRQSFNFKEYSAMNREVMFSYLRPWLTTLSGIAYLGLAFYSFLMGTDPIRLVLAVLLSAYFLVFPWILFYLRVNRVFRVSEDALASQVVVFNRKSIEVQAADSVRQIKTLTDIAVTPNFLLLFFAGSNYVQIRRNACGKDEEMKILAIAGDLVKTV